MASTLSDLLPSGPGAASEDLLGRFLQYAEGRGLRLYPAQEAAILELFEGRNVILGTPTGSGKSLVAAALHFQALAQGRRSVYTCPIKALVNEKWLALCRDFGPENVGLATGDAVVNRDAPILCCTAEILANMALREGAAAPVADVVMDEFHYYADRDRGVAWQVPLLTLPQARFLLMSATLGDTGFFEEALTALTGRPTVAVKGNDRPVPLDFSYSEAPLSLTLERLVEAGRAPVYLVHFAQADAAASAQDCMSLVLCNRDEKAAIAKAIEGFKFNSPYGPDLKRWLRSGIGLHHAGLLPKYRILVEKLAQQGLLKIICGTDTLGVGINVPIRTVLFTRLCKYDGHRTAVLSARDFHQIAGRAGRKGFDEVGYVVAQAPEHVIENIRLAAKNAAGGRKFVKRQPPEHNYAHWDQQTFERLQGAAPERLVSRFQVSHAMLLNVLSRPGDGCASMRALIRGCHEQERAKAGHVRRAWQLFRAQLARGIVAFRPGGKGVQVNVDLQEDFSLDQALSLYLLDTLQLLDPEGPDYALDLLTLVEAIIENPEVILRSQLHKLKGEKVAEMKAAGIEYEQRMAELEKLEHPKPLRDFIYSTFNAFAAAHPWIGEDNIRPKSIVREMFETYRSFSDYVKEYDLQRSEGLLLRHLNAVYKVLAQTVPDSAKDDAVREMELYLQAMLRQVDSSLLDEWERLRDGAYLAPEAAELRPPGADRPDLTRDRKAFTAAIRNRVFTVLRALQDDPEEALALLAAFAGAEPVDAEGRPWSTGRLQEAVAAHAAEHGSYRLDAEGRNLRHTYVVTEADTWTVQQMLVDAEAWNDWAAEWRVDLAASREAGAPVLALLTLGPYRGGPTGRP